PDGVGTKAAAQYRVTIDPGATEVIRLRLSKDALTPQPPLPTVGEGETELARSPLPRTGRGAGGEGILSNGTSRNGAGEPDVFADFEAVFAQRMQEADAFYASIHPAALTEDERRVQRQALAGLIWSKQCYYFEVGDWLNGDPAQPAPPDERKGGRNHEWM